MKLPHDKIRKAIIDIVGGADPDQVDRELVDWLIEVGYLSAEKRPTNNARVVCDMIDDQDSWNMFSRTMNRAGISSVPWDVRIENVQRILVAKLQAAFKALSTETPRLAVPSNGSPPPRH